MGPDLALAASRAGREELVRALEAALEACGQGRDAERAALEALEALRAAAVPVLPCPDRCGADLAGAGRAAVADHLIRHGHGVHAASTRAGRLVGGAGRGPVREPVRQERPERLPEPVPAAGAVPDHLVA